MKLLAKLGSILDNANRVLAFLAGIVVTGIMLLMCYEVIMRYFFDRPPPWVVEICEYMLFTYTFLATAWLLKERGHIRVDILLENISPRNQKVLNMVTSAIGAIICLIIAWYGVESTWTHFQEGIPVVAFLNTPKFILLAFIPFGCFLLSIQFIRQAYGYLISSRTLPEKEQVT